MGRRLRLAPIPVYLTRPGDHVNVPYAPCARAHRLKDRIRRADSSDELSLANTYKLDGPLEFKVWHSLQKSVDLGLCEPWIVTEIDFPSSQPL